MEGCCNFGRPSASRKKGPCGPLLGELVSFRLMQANAELAVDGHGLQDDVEALAVFVREGAPDFQPFSLGLTLDLEFPNREGVKALSGLGLGVGGGLGHDVSLLEYADCVGSSQQTKQVGLAPGTSRSAAQVEGQNKVEEVHPCKPTSFASVPMKSNRPKQGIQGSTLPALLSVFSLGIPEGEAAWMKRFPAHGKVCSRPCLTALCCCVSEKLEPQAQGQTLGERKTSGARQGLGMEARREATKCVMRARFNPQKKPPFLRAFRFSWCSSDECLCFSFDGFRLGSWYRRLQVRLFTF